MRIAVVAGPDAGHAFPALALCRRLRDAGDRPVLYTGPGWLDAAAADGIVARELRGLELEPGDADLDAGRRIHQRAARMAELLRDDFAAESFDLVVADVLTAGGGLAAESLGLPWVELSPHPLYRPSRSLPPIGSGLDRGQGPLGRGRDVLLRAMTGRAVRTGLRQRAQARVGIGLPAADPGPVARLIATIPDLELARVDWPAEARVVGALHWEPTDAVLDPPAGPEPLVMVAPSTAATGAPGMLDATVEALGDEPVRVVISALTRPAGIPEHMVAGAGRQDLLLERADVVVCGAGHGMLTKALTHGVPVVAIPGGGDQWELAHRAARRGAAVVVRPATAEAVRAAVRTVLDDPSYRRAARRAAGGVHRVVDPVAVCHAAIDGIRVAPSTRGSAHRPAPSSTVDSCG